MTITPYDLVMLCNGGPYHGKTLHVSKGSDRVVVPLIEKDPSVYVGPDAVTEHGTYVVQTFARKGNHWYELVWDSPERDWDKYL